MMRARSKLRPRGFTLIELLTALGIFLLITGAAFTLLSSSQQRYQTESQVLTSFQEARLGLDQMVRDINDAGFPPPPFVNGNSTKVTSTPFAWSPGYPNNPCQIGTARGGTCTTATDFAPGDFDLIIETEPNPLDPACTPNCQVQWIRYQLQGTTLMRGMAPKVSGGNPDSAFTGQYAVVPFVQNVVNNVCPQQLSNCHTAYPLVFPGGNPVPIFQYTCDTPSTPQFPLPPCASSQAGPDNSPKNIRDVIITLIVAAPLPDATTGRPRLVQLEGRGRRINPNQ
jgi:prepilin-type N-terminal cleavage/methylation domain-containing protein